MTASPAAAYLSWTPYHGRSQSFIDSLGVEGIYVHYLREHRPLLAPLKYGPMFVTTMRRLFKSRPRVLFVMDPPLFAVTAAHLYCRLTRSTFVMDCHSGVFESWKWRWLMRLQQFHARRAAALIVTNESHAEIARAWGAQVHIVGNPPLRIPGGDNDPSEVRSDLFAGVEPGEPFVFVINRFQPDEVVPEVLDAARQLPTVRFLVSGDVAKARSEWLQDVPANLRFTGWLTLAELWAVARRAAVYLVLTTQDNTILQGGWEAMYLGTPLVTSTTETLRGYFTQGAVFVDPTGPAIAAGVRDALDRRTQLASEMASFRDSKVAQWNEDRRRLEERLGVRFAD